MYARIRFGTTLLLAGAALAAGPALAAKPGIWAGDCFIAGFKAGSADATAACYAEDAVMWFPGGPMAKGRAAIRDGFAGYFKTVTVKDVALTEIGNTTTGNTRTTWGTYAIRVVDNATKVERVERGRYTDVQKKIKGRWLYIVDHPSDDPAPAAK